MAERYPEVHFAKPAEGDPSWFRVRSMRPDDVPYIMQTWISVLQEQRQQASPAPWRVLKDTVRQILPHCTIRVASLLDDIEAILGFAVISPAGDTLFAYTRRSARGLGVCRALFEVTT